MTVRGQVDASRIPVAAQAPAFRLVSPDRSGSWCAASRRMSAGSQDDLIGRLNATSW